MYHFPTSTIKYISLICSLTSINDSTNHPVAQLKFGDMFSISPFPSPSLFIPNKNPKYQQQIIFITVSPLYSNFVLRLSSKLLHSLLKDLSDHNPLCHSKSNDWKIWATAYKSVLFHSMKLTSHLCTRRVNPQQGIKVLYQLTIISTGISHYSHCDLHIQTEIPLVVPSSFHGTQL